MIYREVKREGSEEIERHREKGKEEKIKLWERKMLINNNNINVHGDEFETKVETFDE